MNPDDDVSDVTRNTRSHLIAATIDFLSAAAMIYYMTHPDVFDGVGTTSKKMWKRFQHRVSIWNACREIRDLPETDSD